MPKTKTDPKVVFDQLKPILEKYADGMTVVTDSDDSYYLDTTHIQKNKKPLYFGSTKIRKSYVSFYLMPIYLKPELLDGISDDLKKRMQGKSCFNFKEVDTELFSELEALAEASYQSYAE
ncbi:MAG: hypothetical protein AAGD96_27900, partial [Chloroflexota bacterium]